MGIDFITWIRLSLNLGRVQALLLLANRLDEVEDREQVRRAAIVFLHASLEDFVRGLAEQFWPERGSSALSRIPLPQQDSVRKVGAEVLLGYGDRTARELLREAVVTHLETFTVSNIQALRGMLAELGVHDLDTVGEMNEIKMLIRRRHQIVHRADRVEGEPLDTIRQVPVEDGLVEHWLSCVQALAGHVAQRLAMK